MSKAKNHTTNYPMDGHKKFCARCMEHNGGCPRNKHGKPLRSCKI